MNLTIVGISFIKFHINGLFKIQPSPLNFLHLKHTLFRRSIAKACFINLRINFIQTSLIINDRARFVYLINYHLNWFILIFSIFISFFFSKHFPIHFTTFLLFAVFFLWKIHFQNIYKCLAIKIQNHWSNCNELLFEIRNSFKYASDKIKMIFGTFGQIYVINKVMSMLQWRFYSNVTQKRHIVIYNEYFNMKMSI